MNPLPTFWNDPLVHRLGWTLVHFVWQGALLAAGYAAWRAAGRGRSANARYLAGCLTLLLMAAAPMATFLHLAGNPGSLAPTTPAPPRAEVLSPAAASAPAPFPDLPWTGRGLETLGEWLQAALPWLVAGWVLGVVLLSGRLAVSWLRLRRTCAGCGEALEVRLGARLRELQHRLRLSRPVRVVRSALVQVPTVLGWFRPVILLPASTLTGLSPVQLDLILAHELAHLRRWDHWVNLFQLAVETLLFYHPAVWWVSRRVREDREHCCDELAVAVCGNRLAYAQALATLEELRQAPAKLALAAADGSLLARIRRILSLPDDERGGGRLSAAGTALLVVGLAMFVAGALLYVTARREYTATARLLLETARLLKTADPLGRGVDARLAPYFVASEAEWIRSGKALEEVATRLDLAARRAAGGGTNPPDRVSVVKRMQRQIQVRPLRDAGVIEIRVRAADPQEAADIANTLVEVHRSRRLTDLRDQERLGIQVLEAELAYQSNRVAELRRQVDDLRTKLSIPNGTGERVSYWTSLEREMVNPLAAQLTYIWSEYTASKKRLETLRELSTNDLRKAILTAVPGEEILPNLLRDLAQTEQMLAKLLQDHSPEHPEVQITRALRGQIETQVNERIQGMMLGLETQVKTFEERYQALSNRVEEGRARMAEEAIRQRQYDALKGELEKEERVYDALYLRVQQGKYDALASGYPYVTILEEARPQPVPRRAGQPLDVGLMAAGAFVSLSGLALRRTGERRAS